MKYEGKDEKEIHRDQITPPEGWIFSDEWKIDINRAVDEEGEWKGGSYCQSHSRMFSLSLSLSLSLPPSQAGSTQLKLG